MKHIPRRRARTQSLRRNTPAPYAKLVRVLLSAFWLCVFLSSAAQPRAREAVTLELGFGGEIVAGHWNPLRVTTRDTPNAELVLSFDQSAFTEPETWAVYHADVPGGGVAVFEDDVFVPEWRQLTWRLVSADRVLASGGASRARRDTRPLTLLLTAQPFRWQGVFGADARVVSLPAGDLPERLAAYDGVATLLIDGSAPAPDPAALVAATSAGVHSVLVEPLPRSHDALAALTTRAPVRLGAGWLERIADPDRVGSALPGVQPNNLLAALLESEPFAKPLPPAQVPLALVTSGYALLVLILLRFAGTPGVVTAVVVAALAGATAWFYLRPDAPQTVLARAVVTSGGALARRDEVRSLFTLPSHTFSLPGAARPLRSVAYTQSGDRFDVALERWVAVDLGWRPTLTDAALLWQGETLHNATPSTLSDLLVVGLGSQTDLAADADLTPRPTEETRLSNLYEALVQQVPPGTAIARSGATIYLALPTLAPLAPETDARVRR